MSLAGVLLSDSLGVFSLLAPGFIILLCSQPVGNITSMNVNWFEKSFCHLTCMHSTLNIEFNITQLR